MLVLIQTEQKKQAAADVLYQYSQFVMVCIGEEVRPSDLRLHLMKVHILLLHFHLPLSICIDNIKYHNQIVQESFILLYSLDVLVHHSYKAKKISKLFFKIYYHENNLSKIMKLLSDIV